MSYVHASANTARCYWIQNKSRADCAKNDSVDCDLNVGINKSKMIVISHCKERNRVFVKNKSIAQGKKGFWTHLHNIIGKQWNDQINCPAPPPQICNCSE